MITKVLKIVSAFSLLALVTACTGMPSVEKLSDLKQGQTILVGKFVLDPPFADGEQNLGIGGGMVKNRIGVILGENYEAIAEGAVGPGDMHAAVFDQSFYVSVSDEQPTYITGGLFWLSARERVTYLITDGLKVTPAKGKALYLGTVTFKRDEFMNITDIDISQGDYEKERTAFQQRYGDGMDLMKAKLTSAR